MPKVLTAARVRVPPTNQADYLATLRELCQFADARGQRIWLFRNAKDPQLFTEFSESQTEMSHRAQASRLPEEIKLEKRLQSLEPMPRMLGSCGPRFRSRLPPRRKE